MRMRWLMSVLLVAGCVPPGGDSDGTGGAGGAPADDRGLDDAEVRADGAVIRTADLYTEPPVEPGEDAWIGALTFTPVAPGRSNMQSLRIGAIGQGAVTVSEIFIVGLRACDRVAAGLPPGEPYPEALDATCIWSIEQRPALPLRLEDESFVDLQIAFRAVGDNPPPATLAIVSDAVDKPLIHVSLSLGPTVARIDAVPNPLAFSAAGGPELLTIRNTGTAPLTVAGFTLTIASPSAIDPETGEPIPEFAVDTDMELPWVLGVSDSALVRVDYAPADEGPDEALLEFDSDDPEAPTLAVRLTSAALHSDLIVEPDPVLFGPPMGPGEITRQVQFINAGDRTLFVTQVSIEQDLPAFRFDGQESFQLRAGEMRSADVEYQPQSAEGSDAMLVVISDADNLADSDGMIRLPLLGRRAD